jgi:hypothetical protein
MGGEKLTILRFQNTFLLIETTTAFHLMSQSNLITVGGAGGFIGGALVADLLAKGHTRIRAIDLKPFEEWYQKFDEV